MNHYFTTTEGRSLYQFQIGTTNKYRHSRAYSRWVITQMEFIYKPGSYQIRNKTSATIYYDITSHLVFQGSYSIYQVATFDTRIFPVMLSYRFREHHLLGIHHFFGEFISRRVLGRCRPMRDKPLRQFPAQQYTIYRAGQFLYISFTASSQSQTIQSISPLKSFY